MRRRIATGLGDGQADYSSSIMPLLPSLSVVSNEAMDTTGTLSLLIEPHFLVSLTHFLTLSLSPVRAWGLSETWCLCFPVGDRQTFIPQQGPYRAPISPEAIYTAKRLIA